MKYNVLWIDDQPSESFCDLAAANDLIIEVGKCLKDGMTLLEDPRKNWDAIILDANCKITNEESEVPSVKTLTKSIKDITVYCERNGHIPWFVYTGGVYAGFKSLEYIIEDRSWDDRLFYNKPTDRNILFENIKKAADNNETTGLKHKYSEICDFADSTNSNMLKDLLPILKVLKDDDYTNANALNSIRKVLELMMDYCMYKKMIPIIEDIKLNSFYKCFRNPEMQEYVPSYIKQSIFYCLDICNKGSHGNLDTTKDVESGKARYLLSSTILSLLDIILWFKELLVKGENPKFKEAFQRAFDKNAEYNKNKDKRFSTGERVFDKKRKTTTVIKKRLSDKEREKVTLIKPPFEAIIIQDNAGRLNCSGYYFNQGTFSDFNLKKIRVKSVKETEGSISEHYKYSVDEFENI